jgi:hypothetical protein
MERIAPSAQLEAQIEELLHGELAANGDKLADFGRLGTPAGAPARSRGRGDGLRGPNSLPTDHGSGCEGELSVAMPQIRGAAERFISRVFRVVGRSFAHDHMGPDHRWVRARAVRSRHREPAPRSRVGPGLQEHRQPHLPGTARPLQGLLRAQPGRGRT